MYIFISVLILLVCILLGLIVLVQNPKGGGLAANFTGSTSQFMGVRQTADFLEKASWTLAVVLLVLSLSAAVFVPRANVVDGAQDSQLKDRIENVQAPVDFQAPPPNTDEDN